MQIIMNFLEQNLSEFEAKNYWLIALPHASKGIKLNDIWNIDIFNLSVNIFSM